MPWSSPSSPSNICSGWALKRVSKETRTMYVENSDTEPALELHPEGVPVKIRFELSKYETKPKRTSLV